MLFEKKIDPRCGYCKRGAPLSKGQIACPKKGIVSAGGSCRSFRYDPLRRIPPRPMPLPLDKSRAEDFSL